MSQAQRNGFHANGTKTSSLAPRSSHEPVALIGIGCRFPGSVHGPSAYWRLLCNGVDAIGEIPADRWDPKRYYDPEPGRAGRTNARWGGFVEGIDQFDAPFFGISPREASRMDPQQRLIMEVAYEALEDAGQQLDRLAGSAASVFIGISSFDYSGLQVDHQDRSGIDVYSNTGGALSIAANRVSYCFDLRGPSVAVDTACASALTAVHMACQSIWCGGSPLALAGGVNVLLSPDGYIGFSRLAMLSPDGRCKAFDASANGFVRSEGAGVVVLKPLTKALADGDRVYAVIRGTAINQDGRTSGLTVPSQWSQEALIREACREAGVNPGRIQYVEAHGTGTQVGDPIEARALGAALSEGRDANEPCVIGSAKTNVGHLEAGSGAAGIIKTALALKHRLIPANLHFTRPNPEIPFKELQLRVAAQSEVWPGTPGAGLAGVNSFGFGGSNAHVVLAEAPRQEPPATPTLSGPFLVPLSARGSEALAAVARSYADFLRGEGATVALPDLVYNTSRRRTHHDHRLALVGKSRAELLEALEAFAAGHAHPGAIADRVVAHPPKLLWIFGGQGPQWWAMGRQLLAHEPVFRDTVVRCDEIIKQLGAKWSLLTELSADQQRSRMQETAIAQPAIFAIQVSLAALWQSWGITPDAVIGHSVGEVAAAYAAGVLTLEEATRVIYHRGRCMDFADAHGKMLAVAITADAAREAVAPYDGRIVVAAVNGPATVTLSGDAEPLVALAKELEAKQVFCRFLQVQYAFHSSHMDPAKEPLLEALAGLHTTPARVPLYSTVTGERTDGTDWGAEYWWQNVRQSVRFADALGLAIDAGFQLVLELSPHPVLTGAVSESFVEQGVKGKVVASLRRNEDEKPQLLRSLAALHAAGRPLAWETLAPRGRFVDLPPYPWQHESCWHESEEGRANRLGVKSHPLLGRPLKTPTPSWEARIDTAVMPYLRDHRVQGHALLPATGYLEIALNAAKGVHADGPYVLEEVRFAKACFLVEGQTRELQTTYLPAEAGFQIFSRAEGPGNGWVPHATGVLRSRVLPVLPPLDAEAVKARCTDEVGGTACYAGLKEMGLEYGPEFQGIERLYRGDAEAFGLVSLPASLEATSNNYHFHPALLDACVQVVFGTVPASAAQNGQREVYLPVEIAEVRVHGRPGNRVWSHARLVERTRIGVVFDVRVYDESGSLLWEARGLRCQSVGTQGGSVGRLDDLAYEFQWELQQRPYTLSTARRASHLASPSEVAHDVRPVAAALATAQKLREQQSSLERDINALCGAFVWNAFTEMAGPDAFAGSFTGDELAAKLNLAPRHRRLLDRFLDWFAEDGYLQQVGERWQSLRPIGYPEPKPAWRDLLTHQPAYMAELMLVGRCGRQLAGVLRGEVNPLHLIFPEGSLSTAEHLYQDSPVWHYYNVVARHAVERAIANLPAGKTLRILEVGAGTGGLTSHVLPKLPADRTEYVFTDLSNHFFVRAQQKFADYPFIQYKKLDLEKDPLAQEFAPHSFDLVLASQVLHATADLKQTLTNLARVLASDGVVVLLESLRRARWVDMVFGLTEGWWRFTDLELRQDHPLLPLPGWEKVLGQVGFTDVRDVASESDAERMVAAVILARGPKAVEAALPPDEPTENSRGKWLLFADHSGVAQQVAEKLRAKGNDCSLIFAENPTRNVLAGHTAISAKFVEDFRRVFQATNEQPIQGIVYCWGLDAPAAEELDAAALEAAQEPMSLGLVSLAQGWHETRDAESRLWVLTRRALSVGAEPEEVEMTQTPLIGLGRVITNEYPKLRCTTLDLGGFDVDAEVRGILAELADPQPEDEIALRGEARYLPRYVRHALDAAAIPGGGPDAPFRLEVARSCTLDGLTLRSAPRRAPAAGEVEIEVVAAGLNFSDVLKALGLYPGLPDGPVPLGIECSGRILAVGEGVTEFRIGDEVVTLAAPTFASTVTVPALLVALKPEHVSFEEAATIPVAFLTAYHALTHLARLEAGEKVLIHSAAGGVGLAAVQIAHDSGAEVFATAGTTEKREFLQALGVSHLMDSRSLGFADAVMDITNGRGVDVVLNSLSGEAIPKTLSVMADYGRFVEIGKRDIYGNSRLGMYPFRKNLSFIALDLDRSMRERPRVIAAQFRKVVEMVREGRLAPIPYRVFPASNIVGAFRYMAQGKHTGKIVVTLAGQRPPVVPAENRDRSMVRADGTYLLTGGLGGFGLTVARWLVDQGAKHLVLTGRRGAATPEAEEAIAAMRQAGAEVVIAKSDVADAKQLADVLAMVSAKMPPLRGVFHMAMVLDDCLLLKLTPERWQKVHGPKISGAWNLHRLTREWPLDFFVCFSSMSSVFGIAGQANYAAANTFLDSLAAYRQKLGLPGLTVNWGYLGEVGYVARNEKVGERFEGWGVRSFSPQQALAVLGRLIEQNAMQVGVMNVDWPKFRTPGVAGSLSPRFGGLVGAGETVAASADGVSVRQTILAADEDQRREVLLTLLRDKVSRVLGTPAAKLDDQKPLTELGLDSLMAVEIRNWVEGELRVTLPIVELMSGPSLSRLADVLLAQLNKGDAPANSKPATTTTLAAPSANGNGHAHRNGHANGNGKHAHKNGAESAATVDELSDAEVDAMLDSVLAEKEKAR